MVFLGLSAAVFGRWVEEAGPRKAMFTAGLCWAGGFFVSAIGVYAIQLWLIYLGYGVIGGMCAWHRLHLAGFDADEMVSRSPRHGDGHGHHGFRRRRPDWVAALGLADEQFAHSQHVGVPRPSSSLGCVYFCFMMFGALIVRVPPPGWKPDGYVPPATATG